MRADNAPKQKILDAGFDISIDFQPHFITKEKWWFDKNAWIDIFRRRILRKKISKMPILFDYEKYINYACSQLKTKKYKEYPSITPMWDNSPRRIEQSFWALTDSTPSKYGKWLQYVLENFEPYTNEENFIFINAWNEWAEGNHLEPDQKWGCAYLETTKKIIDSNQ